MARLRDGLQSRPPNTALTWLLVAGLSMAGLATLAAGDLLWTVYALAVVVVAVIPVLVTRDGTTLVSWEPLALAALPVAAHWLGVVHPAVTYVSVAALALLVAVEVDAFSAAEMSHTFAVLFVVLTTLSVASLWSILQYASDLWLGTTFLAGRVDLMWDFVAATAAGAGAGLLFELYFRAEGDGASIASGGPG